MKKVLKMKLRVYLFVATYLITAVSAAQPFNIHLDKPFYIVGETIHYQIYPDTRWLADSMLVYVELYSSAGVLEAQHLHRLKGKSTGGQLELPVSYKEGIYQLIVYSVWDDTQSDSMLVKSRDRMIPIYNDLESKPGESIYPGKDSLKDNIPSSSVFHMLPRTENTFSLNLSHQLQEASHGEFSISILQEDYDLNVNRELGSAAEETEIDRARFKPRKQLILTAKVSDPLTHKPITDKHLSLYIPSKRFFKRIQANQGRIKIIIPDLLENFEVQVLSLNPNSRYPLELNFSTSNLPANKIIRTASKPERTPAVVYLLTQYAKKRLIDDIFWNKPAGVTARKDSSLSFVPDRRFVLSAFQELNTLEEFIKEVMLDARITTIINNKKSLRLRNKEKNVLYQWPAWYMLDGIFQADEEAMLNFEISKIKSIDLYHRNQSIESQFDPIMRYNGIFSINTYLREEPKKLVYTLNGLTGEISTKDNEAIVSPGPDLRSGLAWQTKINCDDAGNISIHVFSGDIKGRYHMSIRGVNGRGKYVTSQYPLQVD